VSMQIEIATDIEALIAVDVQPDFLPGGALGVANGREVIPALVEAAGSVDMVIASRDWHSADHVSFALNTNPYEALHITPDEWETYKAQAKTYTNSKGETQLFSEVPEHLRAFDLLMTNKEVVDRRLAGEGIWPAHCVAGTLGAAIVPEIDLIADLIISKGTLLGVDAYSAFSGTGLAAMLHGAGVTHLKVGGIATDYCVKATVLDALIAGFQVSVIEAGCRAVNVQPGDGEAAIKEMVAHGAVLI
jgi:nicotinamidase/pyrazinamidase